jgi:hypothetical protein
VAVIGLIPRFVFPITLMTTELCLPNPLFQAGSPNTELERLVDPELSSFHYETLQK